ncbi:MAG TPA: FHA domain-containing protein, partial [Chloroflexota bacterium]|nr:FHA domain-containing protein [Chloroflexota bacterium]
MARCLQCQHENIEGALFCDQCGATLGEEAPLAALRPRRQTDQLIDPYLAGPDQNRPETVVLDDRDEEQKPVAAEPPPDSFFLITASGRRIPLPSQEQVILGRVDSRSGVRPDIDLSLEGAGQAGVSRRHCRLMWRSGQWLVEDLMSTNYTFVNGARISSHTPTTVSSGDELRLGKLVLTVGQGVQVG